MRSNARPAACRRGPARNAACPTSELPQIAIATGDPAGIGPEVSLKAALDAGRAARCAGRSWSATSRRSAGTREAAGIDGAAPRDRRCRATRPGRDGAIEVLGGAVRRQRRAQRSASTTRRMAAPRSRAPRARSRRRAPARSTPWWRRRTTRPRSRPPASRSTATRPSWRARPA